MAKSVTILIFSGFSLAIKTAPNSIKTAKNVVILIFSGFSLAMMKKAQEECKIKLSQPLFLVDFPLQ